uniref:Uncharacterized protein n=1 Tax=Anguilla anguilla TaxID=7936 RepID=A0A0E9UCL8_ANGAN
MLILFSTSRWRSSSLAFWGFSQGCQMNCEDVSSRGADGLSEWKR